MASPSTRIDDGRDVDSDNSGPMREKLSVLIVDDELLVRKVHERLVSKLEVAKQVQTQTATNGKEALDLHLSGSSFDIILVDLQMPIMDGTEATKELRAMGVESMIVGVTSVDAGADKEAFMEAGLDECLAKPLTADKIKSLVETLEKNK
ncbi:two-component response regulator 24-like isoform X1 [Syzygium oleosum]|uniref:two-component response regulator 24-like isoform X1 n=1 Tax=Syzygium oleosum TaxID=219896 RepID=UPI0024B87E46|nr:two-component response regulator 24-like isoform X1 [Syzygium oleosum]XP_056168144.1 two-component response regulator 24-like isoform X1 [Syzygium oleosum]